jgi:hypothetical protein
VPTSATRAAQTIEAVVAVEVFGVDRDHDERGLVAVRARSERVGRAAACVTFVQVPVRLQVRRGLLLVDAS